MTKHSSFSGRVPVLSSAPSDPVQGQLYFDSTDNTLMRYDGSNWRGVALDSTTTSTSTSTTTTSTSTTTTSTSTSTTTS